MKKAVIFLLGCLISICSFAQEFEMKLIDGFENKKGENSIVIRKASEVDVSDDVTGNILSIAEDGTIIIHCRDLDKLVKLTGDYKLKDFVNLKGVINSDAKHLEKIYGEKFIFSGSWADYILIDKDGKEIFGFNPLWDYNIRMDSKTSYYLEEANVLFFWDNNENIYSVVNPGMDKEENRKKFHNTEETKRMFKSDVEMNGVKIRVTNSNNIFINGNFHFWKQDELGNYRYQKVTNNYFLVYNKDNIEEKYRIKFPDDTEVIESSALHPSGDIYVLRMNWQTNTHNLYYIENTWDSEWRTQWYKENPSAIRP